MRQRIRLHIGAITTTQTADFISNVRSGEKWSSGIIGAFVGGSVGMFVDWIADTKTASCVGAAAESITNEFFCLG